MRESLSLKQARKLVVLSQRLTPKKQAGPAIDATLAAIEHLGSIQIDTISIIQRAHHHTLWNRNPRYQASQLDQLLADQQVFEYWSHAAAVLPMRDAGWKHGATFAVGLTFHYSKSTSAKLTLADMATGVDSLYLGRLLPFREKSR